jgi:hypothetical protein
MRFIIIGQIGSDAGYWTIENGHPVHHGGWEAEKLADLTSAASLLGQTARLKTPGLADIASKGLAEFVQRELSSHLGDQAKGGTIVIVNAQVR